MSIKLLLVGNKQERSRELGRFVKEGFKEISGSIDLRYNFFIIPSTYFLPYSDISFSEDVILKDMWRDMREGKYEIFYTTVKTILNWGRYYGVNIKDLSSQQESFERFKEEYLRRMSELTHNQIKSDEIKVKERLDKGVVSNPYSIPLYSYVDLAEKVKELVIIANSNEKIWMKRLESLLSSHGFNVVKERTHSLANEGIKKELRININRFSFVHTYNKHMYTYPRNVVFFYFKSLLGLGLKRKENRKKIMLFIEEMLKTVRKNISKERKDEIINMFLDKWSVEKEEAINYIFDLLSSTLPFMYDDNIIREMIKQEVEELKKAFYLSNKLREENGDIFLINAIEDAMKIRPLFIKRNSLYLPLNYIDFLTSPSPVNIDLLPAEMSKNIIDFSNPSLWDLESINILVFRQEDIPLVKQFIHTSLKDNGRIVINVNHETKQERSVEVKINKFSYSQLDMYASCPYKYYMKYILYLPSFPQPFFEFGSIVHEALEGIIKGQDKSKVIDEARESILSNEIIRDKDNALDILNKVINTFIEKNNSLSPHTTLALESFFSLPLRGGEIIGYIDRVIEDEKGIKIIDYKTSKSKKSIAEVERDEQLALYTYAFSQKYGREVASVLLWYVVHDEIVEAKVNRGNIESIIKAFEERIENIKRGTFYPVYGQHCSFCDMFMLCPIYNSYFYFYKLL